MKGLSDKEIFFLTRQKDHESLCIKKYTKYINEATDVELENLFSYILEHEKDHLNTVNKILNGNTPDLNEAAKNSPKKSSPPEISNTPLQNPSDGELVLDALSTERYVSSTYNEAIFEFTDPLIRQDLNHIEKEEQEHGEHLLHYLNAKGYSSIP